MSYFILDDPDNGEEYIEWFNSFEAAKEATEAEWRHLSSYDKKHRRYFAVCIGEIDEDGCLDYEKGYDELIVYKDEKRSRV